MTKASKGLIALHLLALLTPDLTPPPFGWRRLISLEEDRPDGYPALAFVHLDETSVRREPDK